jgi:Na+/melibiose symporter-like transporter
MITSQERDELVRFGREDGRRFYQVVQGIYRFLIIANWVTASFGALFAVILLFQREFFGAVVLLVSTAFSCAALYIIAVLVTHGAKVLVHILFSNLAIMEARQA